MTTDIAKPEDFQTRMFERIKAQMGDLMTDAELKKIVEAAVQKAFFSPTVRVANPGAYSERREEGPAPIVTMVKELLDAQVKVLATEWLEAHKEEVSAVLSKRLDAGLLGAVVGAFNELMSGSFYQMRQELMAALQSMPR